MLGHCNRIFLVLFAACCDIICIFWILPFISERPETDKRVFVVVIVAFPVYCRTILLPSIAACYLQSIASNCSVYTVRYTTPSLLLISSYHPAHRFPIHTSTASSSFEAVYLYKISPLVTTLVSALGYSVGGVWATRRQVTNCRADI